MTRKLIRDGVPELIRANGQEPIVTTAVDDADMLDLLAAKLREETDEFCDSYDLAELIDVLEVVYALATAFGGSPELLEEMRAARTAARGGFTRRLVWLGNHDGGAA